MPTGQRRRKPTVKLDNRQLDSLTDECMDLLRSANSPPALFQRGAQLVRIRNDKDGRTIIDCMTPDLMVNRLAETIRFVSVDRRGNKSNQYPPTAVAKNILAMDSWPFPGLIGVVEMPVLRTDGTVLDAAGYDPTSQLVYAPAPDLRVPRVQASPSRGQVNAAGTLIADILSDFPFAGEADRANLWAALITPVIRPFISGQVPACVIEAPKAGTGKSLLTEIIVIIATGRPASMMGAPRDDENEWRKAITAVLRDGPAIVVIDNIDRGVSSAALSRALTASIWSDRLLGVNQTLHIPSRACWFITGNNPQIGGDLPRRVFDVRLDAAAAEPWLRGGFKYQDLSAHVAEYRGNLIWAILTIARAWLTAGRPVPEQVTRLGNFTEWCEAIGGILGFVGVGGFLGNLRQSYDRLDADNEQWQTFFTWWSAKYGEKAMTLRELARNSANGWESEMPNYLPDYLVGEYQAFDKDLRNNFLVRLGNALRDRVDTVWADGLTLRRTPGTDSRSRTRLWQVVRNA